MLQRIQIKGIAIGIVLLFFGTSIVPFVNIVKAEEIWNVTILCDNADGQSDYVTFGEATDANDGPPVDAYDVLKPPAGIPPYIRAWFNDNLPVPYDILFSDYRLYPDTSKVWNLTVHWMPSSGSSPTTITLSWDTTKVDDSEYGSVTLCTESGTPLQNMLIDSNYIFSCPAYVPQNFKIVCSGSTNEPPNTPSNPLPLNATTDIPVNTQLSWTGGDPNQGDIVSYDVYFGTTNPPPKVIGNQTVTTYTPGTLNYQTTYYWKIIAWDNHGAYTIGPVWHFTTQKQNQPPAFGTPQPANNSINRPLDIYWNVPLIDPNGDTFTWSIQCSNGQTKTKNGETNGTKQIHLTGLAYFTSYKVWVNATDPGGSGLYTRRWYTFTTINQPPNQPQKPTGPTARLIGQLGTYWVNGTDPDGDKIQYRFDWNASGSHLYSAWLALVNSGQPFSKNHSWAVPGAYVVKVQSRDEHGAKSVWSDGLTVTVTVNHPPNQPETPTGPTTRLTGQLGTYWVNGTDPDGDKIQYRFDWNASGSHQYSAWLSLVNSGQPFSKNHSWTKAGTYVIKVQSRDEHGAKSVWSNGLIVVVSNRS
jgi:hypothetical protein